jgi:hypothetical protein
MPVIRRFRESRLSHGRARPCETVACSSSREQRVGSGSVRKIPLERPHGHGDQPAVRRGRTVLGGLIEHHQAVLATDVAVVVDQLAFVLVGPVLGGGRRCLRLARGRRDRLHRSPHSSASKGPRQRGGGARSSRHALTPRVETPPIAKLTPGDAPRPTTHHPGITIHGPVTESSSICGVSAPDPPGKSRRTYCACVGENVIVSLPVELDGELPTVCHVVPSVEISKL